MLGSLRSLVPAKFSSVVHWFLPSQRAFGHIFAPECWAQMLELITLARVPAKLRSATQWFLPVPPP